MKKILSGFTFLIIFTSLEGQTKFTDPRDGIVYKTITVDGATWIAENLKYKVPGGGVFCFDNNSNNIPLYGRLYEWKSAVQACPAGWHLPSGKEFHTLADYFEQDRKAWENQVAGHFTFGIQLGGMQNYEGTFTEMDESAYYWTSTEYGRNDAEYFSYLLFNNIPAVDISRRADVGEINGTEKSNKYSVRCVKN